MVTPEQKRFFQEQGFLRLEQVFSPQEVEEWGVPILHKPFRVDELRALIKERAQTIKGAS